MAALHSCPVALRLAAHSSAAAVPVSCSLFRLPFIPRRTPTLRLASHSSGRRRRRGGALCVTMMDTAASSYASALADVAESNGTLEATIADMEKVEKVFADPAVQSFFANPTMPLERKLEMAKEIAASCEVQPHTANFLNIVVDMGRTDIISDIYKEFELAYNKITNTEIAIVSSVVRLESQDLAQIAQVVQKLTGAKNVRLKTELDPSLIAGFTIRYGLGESKIIDMSVRKQLDEIASELEFTVSLAD